MTPPETLALGRESNAADTPGWMVRVVPNLYPALERQEVVVHTPRHVRSFAELEVAETDLVAAAWRSRALTAQAEGFPYLHAMVNEGRFAGASLAHSHSQLVWLREPPPALVAEAGPECRLCALIDEAAERHVVAQVGPLVAFCHPAGRAPYELVIAPAQDHGTDLWREADLPAALRLLRDVLRRLRAVEGTLPWNAWLHAGEHWHIEVLPRLTVFAGLELGAEIYVNVVSPEDAAIELREAKV